MTHQQALRRAERLGQSSRHIEVREYHRGFAACLREDRPDRTTPYSGTTSEYRQGWADAWDHYCNRLPGLPDPSAPPAQLTLL